MDRLLFGDNQFFGVNHMSEEKARAQAMRFQSLDAVIEVLDAAYDAGVRTFMCTTHDRDRRDLRPRAGRTPSATRTSRFYPCMPYAHKYANAVTEDGMLGAVKRFLPDEGLLERRDPRRLVDGQEGHRGHHDAAHRRRDEDVRGPRARRSSSFRTWSSTCCWASASTTPSGSSPTTCASRYDAEPGFITMNLPALLPVLEDAGHREPDRLLEHQQDRLPHVRRARGLRDGAARAPLPRDRDVGLRVGRDPRRRGDRVGLRAAEHRVDRVRRLERAQHPADPRPRGPPLGPRASALA